MTTYPSPLSTTPALTDEATLEVALDCLQQHLPIQMEDGYSPQELFELLLRAASRGDSIEHTARQLQGGAQVVVCGACLYLGQPVGVSALGLCQSHPTGNQSCFSSIVSTQDDVRVSLSGSGASCPCRHRRLFASLNVNL